MSSINRSQKSIETFGSSQSSSSRRVMWKLNDDEETFDSMVNYKLIHSNNSKNDESLPSNASGHKVEHKSSYAIHAWQQLFMLIRANKLSERLNARQHLGIRYKPSRESLKSRRMFGPKKLKNIILTHVSCLESCLPPRQMALVREVAPIFGKRIPNDTDSVASGELGNTKNNSVINISNVSSELSHTLSMHRDLTSGERADLMNLFLATPSGSLVPLHSASSFRNQTKRSASNLGPKKRETSGNKNLKSNTGKTNNPGGQTFRERQTELHRYRVLVEQRRLELLDLKIARERAQLTDGQAKSCDDSSNA